MRIGDLSQGERFFLSRKRDGLSMAEVAEGLGITLAQYRAVERDEATAKEYGAKLPQLGKLEQFDIYRVLRLRSGKTVAELAEEVGCCQWWFRLMEMGEGDDTRLREYWKLG